MKNFRKNTMIAFDDAFEIMMGSARRLGMERVGIERALNRVLTETIVSDIDMPPFNKSAMDGYACRRADLANELTIIETIPAGLPPKKTIGRNQCAKIMTGAVVPEGADCVIMVEYTEPTSDNKIRFTGSSTSDNICLKGEDIKKGDVVLQAGCKIAAQHIAVLANHGWVEPLVSLQPRVGIIATGDELVEPSRKPTACQIRNSNGFQLAAQVVNAAATATNYGIAVDTEEALDRMIKRATTENDVVILSGGVSVGDYDLVREILEKNNIKLLFEKVAVKPGRPMVFGVSDEVFCFGLPGNPVSTFVMFELLVKPFLFKMMGHDFKHVVAYRQLEKTIARKKTERDSWLPVVFTNNNKVARIEYHGSAHINALCEADGLLCIPAGAAEIKEGTTVAVRQI
ncbi:Molybdopterin molybdenumtransferase [subsurface metagenome]